MNQNIKTQILIELNELKLAKRQNDMGKAKKGLSCEETISDMDFDSEIERLEKLLQEPK